MKKSDAVLTLIEKALVHDQLLQKQARSDSRGGLEKRNTYATDFGRCPRQVWYSLRNYPESNPPDVQSLANFLFGHAAEEAYARILEQLPGFDSMVIIREIRLEADGTSGRADFLLWDPHLRCLIELKTTKSWQAKHLPQKEHEKQLMFYMHCGKLGMLEKYGITPDDCDTGVICYIMKDATRGRKTFLTYDVHYQEHTILQALHQNKELMTSAASDLLPPPRPQGYTESKFPCSYCSYKDTCWG